MGELSEIKQNASMYSHALSIGDNKNLVLVLQIENQNHAGAVAASAGTSTGMKRLDKILSGIDDKKAYHRQIGHLVARAGVDYVWFIGPSKKAFMKGLKSGGFNKTLVISDGYEESLASEIHSMLEPGDIVAIKGSRGIKLERVLEKWDTINFDPVQK